MSDVPDTPVDLSGDDRAALVEKKATCPFIGSAVAQRLLPVRNTARDPLARIEDVRRLGNTGGSDLGDLLAHFASGNHAFMRGASGWLDVAVPGTLFSLDFPGSQGSHSGHSGILQGDPATPDSGRLSEADLARLTRGARDGVVTRSEVGRFIAENLRRDPRSKVDGRNTAARLAADLADTAEAAASAFMRRLFGPDGGPRAAARTLEEQLTKLAGEDNLVGSAGEFGLLFAFLANSPRSRHVAGEPAVAVLDLSAMFVEKTLPDGWDRWKKSRADWVRDTTGLLISAAKEYHRLERTH
jgi:hypothetical protein